MKDLLLFLVLAAIGYFVGSKLRSHQSLTKWSGHVQTTAIMVLIFTMGVCLPVIAKSTRSDVTVYSFLSGLIHAASVPVLIPLLLGL